jgi:hypothetical protein
MTQVGQVSLATTRNWKKLGVDNFDGKLTSRANKKLSRKNIIPLEYFDNTANIPSIEGLTGELLESGYEVGDVLYSLGVGLLRRANVINEQGCGPNEAVNDFLEEYEDVHRIIDYLVELDLPEDETDLLGLIYQCLLTEGDKNTQGSYYTPKNVVRDMVAGIDVTGNQKILDPCCGSLVYPLNIQGIKPTQIYAMDLDPIAVMLSKFNYFLKFPDAPRPNIYQGNYLDDAGLLHDNKYDYIITNPPWGAETIDITAKYPMILSREVFSCFLVASHRLLKEGGQIKFLLPESILNVKVHRDVREFILHDADLTSIKVYPELFSGVTTKYAAMTINQAGDTRHIKIDLAGQEWDVEKNIYETAPNFIFRLSDSTDEAIIEKVLSQKKYDLSESIWALGIVTGNNKQKLHAEHKDGMERIFTGKDIELYTLKAARYSIDYDRLKLQQVAKEEIYRAKEKLAYKFISKKLTFAVDESGSLFLNSANILIPNIPNMSVKTVAALLNSELYQYLYIKMFREIKILKGNLLQLPFPEIDTKTDMLMTGLVSRVINGEDSYRNELQEIVFGLFNISETEMRHIRKELHGPVS